MPIPCTACTHKSRTAIDAALSSGQSAVSVAKRYKLHLRGMQRHAAAHVPVPSPVEGAYEPPALIVEHPTIESGSDVVRELRRLYYEANALLESAKASGDTRLQDKAISTATQLLERLAKAYGLFSDQPIVNVNTGEQKMLTIISGLTDAQLDALHGLTDDKILAVLESLPGGVTHA